jgi:D-cysteine desulfhydrase family pyridoxal phosphate-dependent enzyme
MAQSTPSKDPGAFPRLPLAPLPTPLEEAPALSDALGGPRILLKRDDLTGLALGGNKARKLEFLLADALAQGADTVITTGASDSNHCRMTAAAAAQLGLRCVLLLGARSESPSLQGNLLLDHLFGAEVHFYPAHGTVGGNHLLPEVTEFVRARGNRPYPFPSGGSTGLGALGYALAVQELMDQLAERGLHADYLIHAAGSGGTQAGLLLGAALHGPEFRILSINIDEPTNENLKPRTRSVYAEGAALLGLPGTEPPQFDLVTGYVGDGYGILSDGAAEAIRLLARTEGVLLDPVYSGKAMAALIDLIRRGEIGADKTVVFLHTGGAPALFTQAGELNGRARLQPENPPRWWGRP